MVSASHVRFHIETVLVVLLDGVPELTGVPSSTDIFRDLQIGRAWDPVLQFERLIIRTNDVDLHCVELNVGLADRDFLNHFLKLCVLAGHHERLNLHADIDVDVAATLVQGSFDIVVLAFGDCDPLGVALAVAERVSLAGHIGVAVGRPGIAVHERLSCSRVERVSNTHLEGALIVTAHKETHLSARWCL